MQRDRNATEEAYHVEVSQSTQEAGLGNILALHALTHLSLVDMIQQHVGSSNQRIVIGPATGHNGIVEQTGGVELCAVRLFTSSGLGNVEQVVRAKLAHHEIVFCKRLQTAIDTRQVLVNASSLRIGIVGSQGRFRLRLQIVLTAGKQEQGARGKEQEKGSYLIIYFSLHNFSTFISFLLC